MKIKQLKTLRMVLSILAVVLAVATAAVGMFWLPADQQELPEKPPSGVSSTSPPQTTPPQATTPPETQAPSPTQGTDKSFNPVIPGATGNPLEGNGGLGFEGQKGTDGWNMDGYEPESGAQPPMTGDLPEGTGSMDGYVPDFSAGNEGAQDGTEKTASRITMEVAAGEDPDNSVGVRTGKSGAAGTSKEKTSSAPRIVFVILCVLLAADLGGIVVVSVMISKAQKQEEDKPMRTAVTYPAQGGQLPQAAAGEVQIGQLHNIGARPYQEDSSGVTRLDDGVLAVVADGMGGLSGGDKVSQKIVYTMLGYADKLRPGMIDGALERMVHGTNEAVNAMLGPEGLYKSGSTLLAVLVRNGRFHWITVGDSHIYYLHEGRLIQLNEEHNRGTELLHKAALGEITYEEARSDPKRNGLTSFIGMGQLRYIDKSVDAIPISSGDRIMLTTDGVFNALPDQTIEAVLNQIPDVQAAADELERLVIQRANPRQDNFTAVILGF